MNRNTIIFWDSETGSLETGEKTQPLQIAAVAINPITLVKIDEFQIYMKPTCKFEELSIEALRVNKITKEIIDGAPSQEVAWKAFVSFIKKYTTGNGHTNAPISSGYNINSFDSKILNTLANRYGDVDKNGIQTLFNRQYTFDLKDLISYYAEGSALFPNLKFDTVRDIMGLSTEGSHNAVTDCKQGAAVLVRFLELHRSFCNQGLFKDTFKRKPDTKGFLS